MKKIKIMLMILPTLSQAYVNETSWNTLVDLKNQKVLIQGESSFDRALLCKRIGLSYSLTSPITNVVVAKKYANLNNIFLYPSYNKRITSLNITNDDLVRVQDQLGEKVIISDASLDISKTSCRLANINNYCDHAPLNEYEQFSLVELSRVLGQKDCRGVSQKIWGMRKLDLSHSKIMSYEILSIVPKLRTLYVEGAYEDISNTLESLFKTRIYGLDKMLPFEKVLINNGPVDTDVNNQVDKDDDSNDNDGSGGSNSGITLDLDPDEVTRIIRDFQRGTVRTPGKFPLINNPNNPRTPILNRKINNPLGLFNSPRLDIKIER